VAAGAVVAGSGGGADLSPQAESASAHAPANNRILVFMMVTPDRQCVHDALRRAYIGVKQGGRGRDGRKTGMWRGYPLLKCTLSPDSTA
jgi:hypothetical protein